jgi:hypothetical protein
VCVCFACLYFSLFLGEFLWTAAVGEKILYLFSEDHSIVLVNLEAPRRVFVNLEAPRRVFVSPRRVFVSFYAGV